MKNGERETSRIQRDYEPIQPTNAQSTAVPGSRIRKPDLDEMGSAANRPVPARSPSSRSRGEDRSEEQPHAPRIRKPTLDEMTVGRTEVPIGGPKPAAPPDVRPHRTIEMFTEAEKKSRRGRPRKTGRPGQ
jgi:excinuclease ABC subunit B